MTNVKRSKIIRRLLDDDIDSIINNECKEYLEDMFMNGFKGYKNMTESELLKEYNAREFEDEIR